MKGVNSRGGGSQDQWWLPGLQELLCSSGNPGALQAFPAEPAQRAVQDLLVIIAPAVVSQGEQNNDPGVKMINQVQS